MPENFPEAVSPAERMGEPEPLAENGETMLLNLPRKNSQETNMPKQTPERCPKVDAHIHRDSIE
jgi:hypothetical protein